MIVIPTESYPLAWPQGVPRARQRHESKFTKKVKGADGWTRSVERSIGQSLDLIRAELRRIGARTVVISSNLPLRLDGGPRADAAQRPGGDPGACVYWSRYERRGGKDNVLVPYALPCDRWTRIADNLYAIALSIEAMRGMERWGAVSTEQAFAGFAALPAGSGEEVIPVQPSIDWRTVLADGKPWPEGWPADEFLAIVKARHRRLIQTAHPDAGGSGEIAAELNAAMEAAEQELRSQ